MTTHWLWWAIGTFGIGGCILIAVGFFMGWPVIIGTKIGRTALAILAALGGALLLFAKARAQGAADEKTRLEKDNADFIAKQKRTDAGIAATSDADLDRVLTDSRKPKAGG